jgi:hypothetical protein
MGILGKVWDETTGVFKDPKNFLKKGLNVGTAAGAGFLTGGGWGAGAGALAEALRQSKKGKVTTNLRTLGQGALTGGATGLVAGGAAGAMTGGTQGGYGGVLANTIKDAGWNAALASTAALPLKAAAVGGIYGLSKEAKRKEEQKKKTFEDTQAAKKAKAGEELDSIIGDITGEGGNSPGGYSTQPYNPNNPGMSFGILPNGETVVTEDGRTVGLPASNLQGGIDTSAGEAGKSAAQILAEADLAQQYREETLGKTKEAQTTSIADLQKLLNEQADLKYQRALPGLYEDLNTRGLLMSSELGNQMAIKQQESYQDTALELAKQQLGYDQSNIGEIKNISEGYLGGRGSALQREMSLEDYARQLLAAKTLGSATMPNAPYTGSSKAGSTATGLAGAQIGAYTGGGTGALAGGALGTLASK